MSFRTILRVFGFSRWRRGYLRALVKLDRSARLLHPDRISLGRYIYIGPNCTLNGQGGIRIGDGSILGPEVVILSSTHDYRRGNLLPYDVFDVNRPVDIGAGVWVGYRAMICPGVKIGDGAIVAMGAVVTRDVLTGHVVGGNPAKTIAERNPDEVSRRVESEAYFHMRHWAGPRPRKVSGGH